jgi:hypothetical protein
MKKMLVVVGLAVVLSGWMCAASAQPCMRGKAAVSAAQLKLIEQHLNTSKAPKVTTEKQNIQ